MDPKITVVFYVGRNLVGLRPIDMVASEPPVDLQLHSHQTEEVQASLRSVPLRHKLNEVADPTSSKHIVQPRSASSQRTAQIAPAVG